MKKNICKILCFLTFIVLGLVQYAFSEPDIRNYRPLALQKGTFVKVLNQREITTATLDEGDIITFITPQPVFLDNLIMIPKDAIFKGYVEELREPVEGLNAMLRIKINKVTFPDGREASLNACISSNGNDYLGGSLTPARYYNKTPHYITGWKEGITQYTPSEFRYQGRHIIMNPNEEMILMLKDDMIFYN